MKSVRENSPAHSPAAYSPALAKLDSWFFGWVDYWGWRGQRAGRNTAQIHPERMKSFSPALPRQRSGYAGCGSHQWQSTLKELNLPPAPQGTSGRGHALANPFSGTPAPVFQGTIADPGRFVNWPLAGRRDSPHNKMSCKTMKQNENIQNYQTAAALVAGNRPNGKSRMKSQTNHHRWSSLSPGLPCSASAASINWTALNWIVENL